MKGAGQSAEYKSDTVRKSKAIVLVGKGHFGFSNKFADDLEAARPDNFDFFFELIKGAAGLHLISMYSYRRSNPKRWYRF